MGVRSHDRSKDMTSVRSQALCALLIFISLEFLSAPVTLAQQPVSLTADIPAQPLAQALAIFARQTGLQLVYVSEVVRRQKSHAVPAGLSADEALALLLEGTGLRFEYLTARSIQILAAAPPRQAAAKTPVPNPLDEVVITGSHLNQPAGDTAAPLLVFTQEELLNGGVQTPQDLLARISPNQSFGGANETTGLASGINGYTAVSLRGLGSQRSLILLNGQRLAPYARSYGQGVDLSDIPPSALERVEVLKDGASAIYGADAIGGVINFVLRHEYQGAEVNANYFAGEHGGANNGRINATVGTGDLATDQYNVFVSADYFQQQPLKASARASTTTAYLPWLGLDRTLPNSFPANIDQPGGFGPGLFNPTIPYPGGATADSCAPPSSYPTQNTPLQCRFDAAHLIETIPEVDKVSVLARLTRQLGTQQQLFAEVSYYSGGFIQRIAPAPVASGFTTTPMTLPPTSPYYPTAFVASLPNGDVSLPLELHYRTVELGPRVDRLTSELWRGVLGLRGELGSWNYELTGNYTDNRQVDVFLNGYPSEPSFGPLLRSGVINPFGFNTAAVVEQMRATEFTGPVNDNRAADYGGTYRMTRRVWSAPGGPVALAFGVEGRRESLEQQNSELYANQQIISASATPIPSFPLESRTVWAVYGEAGIPIATTLALDLALRSDYYSDFGSDTNPKVSLRWQALPTVAVRAAYGTGFRVPTLSDLYLPPEVGSTLNTFDDPLRCPVTHSPNDCATNFLSHSGGNPALRPEKSRQWGAGLVVGPLSGWMTRFDYFQVEVRDVIDTLQADEIFADYPFWAPTHVVRGPPEAPYPSLPGPIDYVIENQINFGSFRTSGIDADISWAAPETRLGRLTFALDGTYTRGYSRAGINTTLFPTGVGTRGPDGAIVRWRHYFTLDWSAAEWGATLTQTYQGGYDEVDLLSCDQNLHCPGTRRVNSYSLWDLQGRYQGIRNITLSLGVRNLFDTPPPVSNQSQDMQVGIDPTYADPRGRMYYLALRYAVK
jgi:iron complex outermembrane receptor protein